MAKDVASARKILVFGQDAKAILSSEVPDGVVVGLNKIDVGNVDSSRVQRSQARNELARKVLVQEMLHCQKASLRSLSAAKARQARMSSSVSSGKSSTISCGVIPPARYSSTSCTVIRRPRMIGLPLRLPGSIVMTLRQSTVEVYGTGRKDSAGSACTPRSNDPSHLLLQAELEVDERAVL